MRKKEIISFIIFSLFVFTNSNMIPIRKRTAPTMPSNKARRTKKYSSPQKSRELVLAEGFFEQEQYWYASREYELLAEKHLAKGEQVQAKEMYYLASIAMHNEASKISKEQENIFISFLGFAFDLALKANNLELIIHMYNAKIAAYKTIIDRINNLQKATPFAISPHLTLALMEDNLQIFKSKYSERITSLKEQS